MYFGNIFNIEAQKLARLEKIDKICTIGELDPAYWRIEEQDKGEFLRIRPLFNTDELSSSNPLDTVIEKNKCLICKNNVNTVISCY